jgi:hypothetical protein
MNLTSGKRGLLVFVAICLLVFLGAAFLEGATRLFLFSKAAEPTVPREVGQFEEILGWSLKPLSSGISSRTGYKIEYRINSKGLRDDETGYEKPAGKFRIVLLGDSRTFGFGVPIEKHFSTLLEGYFKDVEVINMGVGGYGVDQQLLSLRSEGFRYGPDLVLAYVAHYGDHRHMHTQRFGKNKPRFVLTDGKLALTNSPVAKLSSQVKVSGNVHDWFVKNSKAYGILYDRFAAMISQNHQTALSQKQQDEQDLKDEAFRKELHELGQAIIYAMHEESLNHGAVFVLATQIKELDQATRDKRVLSIDVAGPLANQKFTLPDDLAHINEAGNGALAWEIASFLRKNQLLPSRHLHDQSIHGDSGNG